MVKDLWDSDNPMIVKVGDLIERKAPIEDIVKAAKIAIEQKQLPLDEGDLCDYILRHAHLLTCYNCGEKLSDKLPTASDDRVGVLHIDPGQSNYPREPDEPAVAYFECIECAGKDKDLLVKVLKDKNLNQIQVDLLSSFIVGHWREISKSEHKVAFERILETLNPGALQAVKVM